MNPGDNCPECDRRLSSDSCPCGWRAASGAVGAPTCSRCSRQDRSVMVYEGRPLCSDCQWELRRINASADDDLTESGETVAQLKTRMREILAANAHKWDSKRQGLGREVMPL